jgi:hypothetical protein
MSPKFVYRATRGLVLGLVLGSALTTVTAQTAGTALPRHLGYAPSSAGNPAPEPEEGLVEKAAWRNEYFSLTYPLPDGWREDFKGPAPSENGYYVLGTLRTDGPLNGSMLIAGQDLFFGPPAVTGALSFAQRVESQAPLSALKIESAPRLIELSHREFARVDYSGAGLLHAVFATEFRCHVISFEVTTRDPAVFEKLVNSMDRISLPALGNAANTGAAEEARFPACVKDYAAGANVIHKVDPVQVGPKYTKVPVRIVIDKQGKVKHIHVIHALPDQGAAVREALEQWVFKPYIDAGGHAAEVETGIMFEFRPAPAGGTR